MVSGIPIGSKGEGNLSDMQPELNPITEKEMLTTRLIILNFIRIENLQQITHKSNKPPIYFNINLCLHFLHSTSSPFFLCSNFCAYPHLGHFLYI